MVSLCLGCRPVHGQRYAYARGRNKKDNGGGVGRTSLVSNPRGSAGSEGSEGSTARLQGGGATAGGGCWSDEELALSVSPGALFGLVVKSNEPALLKASV